MLRYRLKQLTKRAVWLAVLALGGVNSSFGSNADAQYLLTLNDDTLDVEICSETTLPSYFTNHDRELSRNAFNFNVDGKQIRQRGDDLYISGNNNRCLSYTVKLTPGHWRDSVKLGPDNVLINTQKWFWFSPNFNSISVLAFDESKKPVQVALPFVAIGDTDDTYKIANTGLDWRSKTLFGPATTEMINIGDKKLRLVVAGNARNRLPEWRTWMQVQANAMTQSFGEFPLNNASVMLFPIGKRNSVMPWGEVQRGGFPSIHLYIDETRPIKEFVEDWTTSHELSHFFVPKIDYRDRWLSEGLASYYQNVLRARSGLLTEKQAWTKLQQGFNKGVRAFNGRSLRNANRTKHVYWGGVAYYFLADLRLREQNSSLDQVLERFNRCCLPSYYLWGAEEFAEKLDELSETKIFTTLLFNEAQMKQFPLSKTEIKGQSALIQKHLPDILKSQYLARTSVKTISNQLLISEP